MLKVLNKTVKKIDKFQEDCAKTIFGLRRLLGEDKIIREDEFKTEMVEGNLCLYRGSEYIGKANKTGIFIESKHIRNTNLFKESTKILKNSMKEMYQPAKVDGQQLGGRMGENRDGVKTEGVKEFANKMLNKFKSSTEDDAGELLIKVEKFIKSQKDKIDENNVIPLIAKTFDISEEKAQETLTKIAMSKLLSKEFDETSIADIANNPNAFEEKPNKRKIVKENTTSDAVVPKVTTNTSAGETVGSKKLTLQSTGTGNFKVTKAVDQGKK
jgi:hypothetical protein